uniref:RUN and TBC1 domain-containing protein 3 n=1 Tax=Parastrongyloides trichosuri TaxID=131310 RepID=A0A0N5A5W9_PARTI
MAKYKKGGKGKTIECAINNDDENIIIDEIDGPIIIENLPIDTNFFYLQNDKPLSAVNRTILPKTYEISENEFNIFGFRKTKSIDESEEEVELRLKVSVSENDERRRMKWLAHIEFTNENLDKYLKWGDIELEKLKNGKFEEMIYTEGVPHSLRPFIWTILSGALKKKKKSIFKYDQVVKQCFTNLNISVDSQIEKDVLRTLPNNVCFLREDSRGANSLRNILRSIAFLYPDLGYCQGIGMVVANILLVCPEEYSFWIMTTIIEDILPPNYYSHSLVDLQIDQKIVQHLLKLHIPELYDCLKEKNVDLSMITANWFLTLFASTIRTDFLFRIWDLLLVYGNSIIFRVIISLLKINCEEIIFMCKDTDSHLSLDVFNYISKIPKNIKSIDDILEMSMSFDYVINSKIIQELRSSFQNVINENCGIYRKMTKEHVLKKQAAVSAQLFKSKSFIQQVFHGSSNGEKVDIKMKNIRQTEIIVNLKNAIGRLIKHFESCDEGHTFNGETVVEYELFNYVKEKATFLQKRREGRKRARALLNFKSQEEDELGFLKNDVISIINDKDEHCWIGELNGRRGWFPAKFVELINEIGKSYCSYGDESVNEVVCRIVREHFMMAISIIFEHEIRQELHLHPYQFIEEIANNVVQKNCRIVDSRLALCNTFKLEQDEKVLTPEELLFRSVHYINSTHNITSKNKNDIKFRSLIAFGLNEQCLHLWFAALCDTTTHESIRKKYYRQTSFIRSPGWVQITCELKVLSQMSFSLNVDYELSNNLYKNSILQNKSKISNNNVISKLSKQKSQASINYSNSRRNINSAINEPLREGVQDVLIKHQLFSWDL